LIRIHNAQGALPDARRLSAVVQRMGTERPGSAALRQLRAEEALSNQQFAVAAMLLRELLEVDPDREALAVTLVDAWTAAGQRERIEAWLEPRLAVERPGRGIVTAAAATCSRSAGRTRRSISLTHG
jgi:thioredoxin-like negative regulator of GroEL